MRTIALLFALSSGAIVACQGSPPAEACDLEASLSAGDCAELHAMALPPALPASVGNAKADDDAAAALGFYVFYDARFSANGAVRCATCHLPEVRFNDAKPVSVGLVQALRNSPTLLNASRMSVWFWDGRADALWSQPLFAFENEKEMGFSRLGIARVIAAHYSAQYTSVFGALPALDDATRFPAAGKPGDAAWESMAARDQETINTVSANIGKALEAYVRKISAGPSAFDRYVGADTQALTDTQKRGLGTFVRAGCLDCHAGPMFSDMKFHNLGVPAADGAPLDRGRADGIPILLANIFDSAGPYSDPPTKPISVAEPTAADVGAFRTPTLRNVTLSGPYAHDGHFAELADIIRFHVRGGGRGAAGFVGDVDPKIVARDDIGDRDIADIVEFLAALVGESPPHPWNDWPQK